MIRDRIYRIHELATGLHHAFNSRVCRAHVQSLEMWMYTMLDSHILVVEHLTDITWWASGAGYVIGGGFSLHPSVDIRPDVGPKYLKKREFIILKINTRHVKHNK